MADPSVTVIVVVVVLFVYLCMECHTVHVIT